MRSSSATWATAPTDDRPSGRHGPTFSQEATMTQLNLRQTRCLAALACALAWSAQAQAQLPSGSPGEESKPVVEVVEDVIVAAQADPAAEVKKAAPARTNVEVNPTGKLEYRTVRELIAQPNANGTPDPRNLY